MPWIQAKHPVRDPAKVNLSPDCKINVSKGIHQDESKIFVVSILEEEIRYA